MTNYFRKPDALVDAVRSILSGQPTETQEDIERKSDVKMVKVKLPDGHIVMRRERPKIEIGKGKNESLDPVDQKALKGKHSDRKDKDIDNDGDVDSSDEYLHKRRKAVSKAMKEGVVLGEAKTDAYHKEMLKALGKSKLPKEHQYTSAVVSNGDFVVYDGGKRIVGRLKKGEHSIKEGVEDNPANTQHLCAKNVVHENWGEGVCIPTMHADPDEDGNIEWYDVMFDHGIEEQVSIEELKVTKAESHIHSSYKKKIKESDDEDDDDMEDDEDDKKKKVGKKGKKDEVDTEPSMDDQTMTAEMSDKQMKKREEIVKSMKKKSGDFKKRYGDRAKDVMYATATKMATKEGFEFTEEELEEMTKPPFDGPYRKVGEPRKDKFGNVIKPKNVAKHLAKKAMASVTKEEVELDEGKMSAAQIAKLKKAYEPMRGKKISMASGQKLSSIMDKVDDDKEALSQLVKADIPFVSQLAVTRLITKHGMKGAEIRKMQEEVELDEALPPHLQKHFDKDGNALKGKWVGTGKNKKWIPTGGVKTKTTIKDVTPKGYGPKEEVELDGKD